MTNLQTLENQTNVGFIGIGNMGFAMMSRLLSQNWPVTAFDIDANAMQKAKSEGATLAHHAGEIASHCRISFLVVVDSAQVNEVLNGPHGYFSKAQAGNVLFLCPTLGPVDVSKFASQAQAKGVQLIDAPMSGGPLRAREGQMSFMLAGPQDVLKPLESLLNAITPHRFFISETAGDAAKTKLANNLLAAINLAGASEVLAMAQAWGLEPQTTLAVMQASSGQSWIGQDRLQRALKNDFEPRAHTTLLAKDTRLAIEACQAMNIKVPSLGALATQQFATACEMGHAHQDDASLFLMAGGKPVQKT